MKTIILLEEIAKSLIEVIRLLKSLNEKVESIDWFMNNKYDKDNQ